MFGRSQAAREAKGTILRMVGLFVVGLCCVSAFPLVKIKHSCDVPIIGLNSQFRVNELLFFFSYVLQAFAFKVNMKVRVRVRVNVLLRIFFLAFERPLKARVYEGTFPLMLVEGGVVKRFSVK